MIFIFSSLPRKRDAAPRFTTRISRTFFPLLPLTKETRSPLFGVLLSSLTGEDPLPWSANAPFLYPNCSNSAFSSSSSLSEETRLPPCELPPFSFDREANMPVGSEVSKMHPCSAKGSLEISFSTTFSHRLDWEALLAFDAFDDACRSGVFFKEVCEGSISTSPWQAFLSVFPGTVPSGSMVTFKATRFPFFSVPILNFTSSPLRTAGLSFFESSDGSTAAK